MLATFIIGLREGVEAALVVGIIAAFLRRSGHGLAAMWAGVGAAIALSLAVGVGLALLERSLPQAAQEGLEAVIGAVAVVFVTGMVLWMGAHGRDLKRRLERDAADAIGRSGSLALALMAFLAVLREGFETSVFLLATFSVAQSAALAMLGAVLGLAVAVVLGWAIYAGGVRLDLARFFKITGAFLMLVAAGLVVSSLRTAHEAGWLLAGQQPALDLSWLVTPGTVRAALLTGVLGIPPEPRLVEVVGWLAYVVPVSLIVYLPRTADPARTARIRLAAAAGCAALALALFLAVPRPILPAPAPLPIVAAGEDAGSPPIGTVSLVQGDPSAVALRHGDAAATTVPLDAGAAVAERHLGLDAAAYDIAAPQPERAPTLTLDEVLRLGGGRLPRGINPAAQPGPFAADWTIEETLRVWIASGRLIDATGESAAVVTLSDGGLATPRTFRVASQAPAGDWQAAPAERDALAEALRQAGRADIERRFWAGLVPLMLLVFAALLALGTRRTPIRTAGARLPAASRP